MSRTFMCTLAFLLFFINASYTLHVHSVDHKEERETSGLESLLNLLVLMRTLNEVNELDGKKVEPQISEEEKTREYTNEGGERCFDRIDRLVEEVESMHDYVKYDLRDDIRRTVRYSIDEHMKRLTTYSSDDC